MQDYAYYVCTAANYSGIGIPQSEEKALEILVHAEQNISTQKYTWVKLNRPTRN
jgi:hypothetical protein